MATITRGADSFPIKIANIGVRSAEELFFSVEMWEDDLETLQRRLSLKESRDGTDFTVLRLSNGGTITIDLSEVLFVSTAPYVELNYTTGEDEFYDDEQY